jgi:hypothetical protein
MSFDEKNRVYLSDPVYELLSLREEYCMSIEMFNDTTLGAGPVILLSQKF